MTLYISLNQTSRGVSPHDDLGIRLVIYARNRSRAGRGSALQGQFDWTVVMGLTKNQPVKNRHPALLLALLS